MKVQNKKTDNGFKDFQVDGGSHPVAIILQGITPTLRNEYISLVLTEI